MSIFSHPLVVRLPSCASKPPFRNHACPAARVVFIIDLGGGTIVRHSTPRSNYTSRRASILGPVTVERTANSHRCAYSRRRLTRNASECRNTSIWCHITRDASHNARGLRRSMTSACALALKGFVTLSPSAILSCLWNLGKVGLGPSSTLCRRFRFACPFIMGDLTSSKLFGAR